MLTVKTLKPIADYAELCAESESGKSVAQAKIKENGCEIRLRRFTVKKLQYMTIEAGIKYSLSAFLFRVLFRIVCNGLNNIH
jgi:hypothetical protein